MILKFFLILTAGACGIAFIATRPRPDTAIFWVIIGPGIACMFANWFIERSESKRDAEKYRKWDRRLKSLVDIFDFEDDGHLHEWFTEDEWNSIFNALESMPKGHRRLRAAIEIVKPEILNEN